MAFIYCKKCGEYRYLTPHAFWNISDLGAPKKYQSTIPSLLTDDYIDTALFRIYQNIQEGLNPGINSKHN